MNLSKIKEDAEIASIDYADKYRVYVHLYKTFNWMVYDRATKEYEIRRTTYYNIREKISEREIANTLPLAARRYCLGIEVEIVIKLYRGETYTYEYLNEIYLTVIEKLKVLNEYPYLKKLKGEKSVHQQNTIIITYTLYSGEISSVPKRAK